MLSFWWHFCHWQHRCFSGVVRIILSKWHLNLSICIVHIMFDVSIIEQTVFERDWAGWQPFGFFVISGFAFLQPLHTMMTQGELFIAMNCSSSWCSGHSHRLTAILMAPGFPVAGDQWSVLVKGHPPRPQWVDPARLDCYTVVAWIRQDLWWAGINSWVIS